MQYNLNPGQAQTTYAINPVEPPEEYRGKTKSQYFQSSNGKWKIVVAPIPGDENKLTVYCESNFMKLKLDVEIESVGKYRNDLPSYVAYALAETLKQFATKPTE